MQFWPEIFISNRCSTQTMESSQRSVHEETAGGQNVAVNPSPGENHAIAVSNIQSGGVTDSENRCFFADRPKTANSLSPEQAFVNLIKSMLGTGLLSLPLAFKFSGLWLGLVFMFIIFIVCLVCMRQVVFAAHYICYRYGREVIDYANVMRGAVEAGPNWINTKGYIFKQLVNVNIFVAQFGFCSVYFVFMADNLENFFTCNTAIHLSKAMWMSILLIPILLLCSIRRLNMLASFAFVANIIYICSVIIVLHFFFTHLQPSSRLPAVGKITNFPLYFGTVMFAFEGVAVILPIENRMNQPQFFIQWNGVLNSANLVVLAVYAMVGFYGYLAVGDDVADTVTLNLPQEPFYQLIKLSFVVCVMVSYPLQFFVPMERIEKWIMRKIVVEKQILYIYCARYGLVLLTCAIAQVVPHLALVISFIGAFSGASLALLFPPCIELLVSYAQKNLTAGLWVKNITLLCFAVLGFSTGTYSALVNIAEKF
ncbi:hypothetical protein AB6A40_003277 [Gnathostoma spinigerum]|uniref:Amino acid transporter transmembrane domain-containing protein n=1 Tax=Gnathostoma spinigerum TaxID=75299 RepID=A0ABD6E931_9BILA